ncbi:MAG: phage head-tail connector protein [Bacillus sp. (in: firmicutes)]
MSELLNEVKSALRITWNDEDADLTRIINRAKAYLNSLFSTSFDFEKDDQPKTLLIERCRYVYNNAAHEFEINYAHEISRLMLDVAIEQASEQNETTPY